MARGQRNNKFLLNSNPNFINMKLLKCILLVLGIFHDALHAQNIKDFAIGQYSSVKLFKCDQANKRVIEIYDLKKQIRIFDVSAEPNHLLVLQPAFRKNPEFYKFLLVLKKNTGDRITITTVNKGEFIIKGSPKIKIASFIKDEKSARDIEFFLSDAVSPSVNDTFKN
jgi:hypothetical protein